MFDGIQEMLKAEPGRMGRSRVNVWQIPGDAGGGVGWSELSCKVISDRTMFATYLASIPLLLYVSDN